ncbi:hypothetical protein Ciccas_003903, partial [Cichlidogyrus casuarinus]
ATDDTKYRNPSQLLARPNQDHRQPVSDNPLQERKQQPKRISGGIRSCQQIFTLPSQLFLLLEDLQTEPLNSNSKIQSYSAIRHTCTSNLFCVHQTLETIIANIMERKLAAED